MTCHKIIMYYEWKSKLKMLKLIAFHLLYKKGRNTATAVSSRTDKQTQGPHLNSDNGSSQAEWISWGIARQERRNLEIFRFGFGNKKRSEPDLTTRVFAKATGTFSFLAPTARSSYSLYSRMHHHPELTRASSEADTKITDFILTSCLQAWIWTSCMPFLFWCFCNPALCDCPKRNIFLAKCRKNAVFPHCDL